MSKNLSLITAGRLTVPVDAAPDAVRGPVPTVADAVPVSVAVAAPVADAGP